MRILTLGYGASGFGFGRVLRSLVQAWASRHAVLHLELAGSIDPDFPGEVIASLPFDGADRLEAMAARAAVAGPDVVFVYQEAFPAAQAVRLFKCVLPDVPIVVYCPVDCEFPSHAALVSLGEADRLCAFTDFGARHLRCHLEALGIEGGQIRVVPHGVDAARFVPLAPERRDGRRMAREMLFPGRPELQDAFIVLNANRNQPRKRLDLTIEAFARLARRQPHAFLYLHAGLRDHGIRLLPCAERLGVADRLIFTHRELEHPRVGDMQLNHIFNACDVGVNTAVGEGWGLVAFEHAATGAAQVVPDHTGCGEVWAGHALLTPSVAREEPGLGTLHEIDTDALAGQLEALSGEPSLLRQWSDRALHHARHGTLAWPQVAMRFEDMFAELC